MISQLRKHAAFILLVLGLVGGFVTIGFASPWASAKDNALDHQEIRQEQSVLESKLSNMDGKLDILIDFAKEQNNE